MQETWVQSLGQKDLLEKEMATHSSIPAGKIPCTDEPGGLQSMGLQSRTLSIVPSVMEYMPVLTWSRGRHSTRKQKERLDRYRVPGTSFRKKSSFLLILRAWPREVTFFFFFLRVFYKAFSCWISTSYLWEGSRRASFLSVPFVSPKLQKNIKTTGNYPQGLKISNNRTGCHVLFWTMNFIMSSPAQGHIASLSCSRISQLI